MARGGYDCTGAAYGSHAHKTTREIYRSLAGPTPRANTPVQGYMLAPDGCATPRASAVPMMVMQGSGATVLPSSHSAAAAAAAAAQTFSMQNGMIGYGYGSAPAVSGYRQPLSSSSMGGYASQQQQHPQASMAAVQGSAGYLHGNGAVRYSTGAAQGCSYGQQPYPMQSVGQGGYYVGGVGVSGGGTGYNYATPQSYQSSRSSRGPYY